MTSCLPWRRLALLLLCGLGPLPALAADDAKSLRDMDRDLTQQLKHNQFQRPMVLFSVESPGALEGDVYAELNYPFAIVSTALNDPTQGPANWCDVLILPSNTKYCHASSDSKGSVLSMNIGQKVEQELADTQRMEFHYRTLATRAAYFGVALDADSGPLGTRDYRIVLEAVALDRTHTFVHLSYAYSFGMTGQIAMKGYLLTSGRGKVGFTPAAEATSTKASSPAQYIGGMRGLVERNAMRYYLAIDAYLDSLSSPPEKRLEQRLTKWFNSTETFSRQLHEIERQDYLQMKYREYRRQQTVH